MNAPMSTGRDTTIARAMATQNTTPLVSVVVPTCGRPTLLHRCLLALMRQRMPAASYEIIVADDGHSDATQALVRRLGALHRNGPPPRYTRSPHPRGGPAGARNAGWRAAGAPVIAFTDDDTIPSRGWLAEGLRAMEPGIDSVTGRTQVPLPSAPTDWQRNTAGLERGEFITANCFVRREALEEIGGFDERYRRPWREDSDLHFAMLERGMQIVRAPGALVMHPVREAPWGVSTKIQRNVYFDALLYKKHPRLYRARISAGPPLRYYFAIGALGVGIAGLLAGAPLLALAGGAAWLAWTAGFAAYRLRHTSRRPRHIAEMLYTSALIPPLAIYWRIAGALHFRVAFA